MCVGGGGGNGGMGDGIEYGRFVFETKWFRNYFFLVESPAGNSRKRFLILKPVFKGLG